MRGRPLEGERRTEGTGSAGVVVQNVATIAALEADTLAQRTSAERLADRIARMAGTSWFALLHIGWFGAWLLINGDLVPSLPSLRSDPV